MIVSLLGISDEATKNWNSSELRFILFDIDLMDVRYRQSYAYIGIRYESNVIWHYCLARSRSRVGDGAACAAIPTDPGEKKQFPTGIFSTFNLYYDVVELYIRVNKEAYSNRVYSIEILPDAQIPQWESIEALEVPAGWNYEKIGDGIKFYTETNPLLKCQGVRFRFKIKAKRISWYMRISVTGKDNRSMGMIVRTRWLLYHFSLM